ncbi:family S53 protease [Mycena vulgaris]|nr:family S53 protease [Mycena vulgaris]
MISISILATLLAFAAANPLSRRTMAVYEKRDAIPAGFVHAGSLPASQEIALRIALHLTAAQLVEYVKPSEATLSAVTEWLNENEIVATPVSPAGDPLQITLPIKKTSDLLLTKFTAFNTSLAFLTPLRGSPGLPAINDKREACAEPSADTVPAFSTPACLQALYGIPTAKATSSATNILAQYANQADLTRFLDALRPDLNTAKFSLQNLDDGINDQALANAGIEANLDIEYTVGVAGGVPVTFISVGPSSNDDVSGFVDIGNFLLAETDDVRPKVLTTSYCFNEPELPVALSMQLAAVGTLSLFASGDGGVGGVQSATCDTFVPTAPSGCPFLTSVGGTTDAIAASLSGGGFNVASYLSSIGDQYSSLYNTTGRGYPDAAAQAESVELAWMGSFWLVDGTSCASPIFTSLIALVNDHLLAAGKPVLEVSSTIPVQRSWPGSFHGHHLRNNPGCNTDGFSAKAGWDPVTGLGTPNFDLLLTAVGL